MIRREDNAYRFPGDWEIYSPEDPGNGSPSDAIIMRIVRPGEAMSDGWMARPAQGRSVRQSDMAHPPRS